MRARLLAWYDENGRDLPWRETSDPYAIWVSEVMCQQTRVDTAIPYYHRFLERFPTTAALATATEDEVLAAWSGLGYYRRARLLHAGVKEVVARFEGQVPADAEARRSLPGVGRYTAGALGSIAFDQPEPIVDGNVARVLSRVFRVETPLGRAETERALWSRAETLVRGPRPGDFNQGLMELGALVCTPRAPRCEACPWAGDCEAREAGIQHTLPVPRPKKRPVPVSWTAVVATRGRGARREVFLERRSVGALFAGLWMVPMVETPPAQLALGDGTAPSLRDDAERCVGHFGLRGRLAAAPSAPVTHVLSHRRYEVRVWHLTAAGTEPASPLEPHAVADLGELPIARLTHKILEATE